MSAVNIRQISLATVLIALGVVIAPFLWFPILASKAFPGQHIVNAVAGVLLGPIWATLIAVCIGFIRMSLGIGTIFSMPGGIPGALIVGISHWLLRRIKVKQLELAALTEPLGTIFVGGTLAVYLVAPIVGSSMLLIPVWIGWSLSCIPGAVVGFIILEALKAAGYTRDTFSREILECNSISKEFARPDRISSGLMPSNRLDGPDFHFVSHIPEHVLVPAA